MVAPHAVSFGVVLKSLKVVAEDVNSSFLVNTEVAVVQVCCPDVVAATIYPSPTRTAKVNHPQPH